MIHIYTYHDTYLYYIIYTITLWFFNIAMENHHFKFGKPIYKWAIFHGYVTNKQRVDYL